MIIMEGMDTMLSDAVSISALLSYDNKYHKFRQLKKQMSNISTPSPSASPEPSGELISIETLENDVISQTVLKTINDISDKNDETESLDNQTCKTSSHTLCNKMAFLLCGSFRAFSRNLMW